MKSVKKPKIGALASIAGSGEDPSSEVDILERFTAKQTLRRLGIDGAVALLREVYADVDINKAIKKTIGKPGAPRVDVFAEALPWTLICSYRAAKSGTSVLKACAEVSKRGFVPTARNSAKKGLLWREIRKPEGLRTAYNKVEKRRKNDPIYRDVTDRTLNALQESKAKTEGSYEGWLRDYIKKLQKACK